MAMRKRSSVTGFKELNKVLKQLPEKVQRRVLQRGTNAAARVFLNALKEAVPRGTAPTERTLKGGAKVDYGRWFQNLKIRSMRRLKNKATAKGSQVYTGNAFWSRFYEFGAEFGTRHQPARPIMRTTNAANMDKAAAAMRNTIAKGIDAEAKKLAGPYAKAKKSLR